MRIVALAGGVGASKLLLGLAQATNPRNLTVIVNTGDDLSLHGLEISPDLDIVTYTLAGVVNPATGWGYVNETFNSLERLSVYGCVKWFNLGDRDLATHIYRTDQLRQGKTLSQVADSIRRALGVKSGILPMSDEPVRTMIGTRRGWLQFQEYLVKLRAKPVVRKIRFEGSKKAKPAPGVLECLRRADGIVICPSNPVISIGPILAVRGIRETLQARRDAVVAVCPIVGGKSLKGPSDQMMRQMGMEVSALGVAELYREICGTMIIDSADEQQSGDIENLGIRVISSSTVMTSLGDKTRLARLVLGACSSGMMRKALKRGKRSIAERTKG